MILAPDVTDCINEAGCIGGACRVGVAGRVSSEDWCSIISSDSVAYTLMTVLSPWKREGSNLDISSILLSSVISLSFLLGKLPNFFLNNFFYFHRCLPSCESCRLYDIVTRGEALKLQSRNLHCLRIELFSCRQSRQPDEMTFFWQNLSYHWLALVWYRYGMVLETYQPRRIFHQGSSGDISATVDWVSQASGREISDWYLTIFGSEMILIWSIGLFETTWIVLLHWRSGFCCCSDLISWIQAFFQCNVVVDEHHTLVVRGTPKGNCKQTLAHMYSVIKARCSWLM